MMVKKVLLSALILSVIPAVLYWYYLNLDVNEELHFTFEEGAAEYIRCGSGKSKDRIYIKLLEKKEEVFFNIYGPSASDFVQCNEIVVNNGSGMNVIIGRTDSGFSYLEIGEGIVNSREDVLFKYNSAPESFFRAFMIATIACFLMFLLVVKVELRKIKQ